MNSAEVQEIEIEIEQAREMIKRKEALDRLYKNPDFQLVIQKGYFEDEAVRLVHLKGAPAMRDPENQAAIIKEMDGIGSLKGYFSAIIHTAANAQAAIEEREALLLEMEEEGNE